MKLPYFQEEMMVKKDPIKIEEEEELGKEADQETVSQSTSLSTAHKRVIDRPVDSTQQRRNQDQIFDNHKGLSIARGQNWI